MWEEETIRKLSWGFKHLERNDGYQFRDANEEEKRRVKKSRLLYRKKGGKLKRKDPQLM